MNNVEVLKSFINNLKTPETKVFIESVVEKGFKVCFEADMNIDEEDVIKISDLAKDPNKVDEVKRKIDEIKATEEVKTVKESELKKIVEG